MEKSQKIIISILAVILAGIITACVIVASGNGKDYKIADFSAPSLESNAVVINVDDIPQSAEYKPLTIKDGFKISMASIVTINNNVADIYFTSDTDNTAWLKIEILSTDGNVCYAKSGLLKQGETLKQIKLDSAPSGDELIIKILSYEPETYYSHGTATVRVPIAK